MKTHHRRLVVSRCRRAAFTLIELLAVMAVILVLAGLIINIAGSAQYNAAKSRATAEIKAISTALESYKTDNGVYPPDPYTPTDPTVPPVTLLNAQMNFDPTASLYINNSEYLYQILTGFAVTMGNNVSGSNVATKKYMDVTPQQLHAVNSTDTVSTGSSAMYLIDPFGFSYGYSTIDSAYATYQATQPAQTDPTQANKYGYNPTFDLWSTAGYAPGAKSTPSSNGAGATDASVYSSLWIKNW